MEFKDRILESLQKIQERSTEVAHERELAAIRAEARALVWIGTQEEFVESILKLYESGCIVALDPTDALIKASLHFVRPDGTAIVKPKSASGLVAPTQLAEKPKPSREEFVRGILATKGWSIFEWATEAEVSHATAIDYLHGKTKPHPSTRRKLAEALGIKAQQLPM